MVCAVNFTGYLILPFAADFAPVPLLLLFSFAIVSPFYREYNYVHQYYALDGDAGSISRNGLVPALVLIIKDSSARNPSSILH
jgi:hypothetical protein